MGIETNWYKKDVAVDSRLNRDFFLSPTKVLFILGAMIVAFILWTIETKSY